MCDRRYDWVVLSPYMFDATFSDGLSMELEVNPEFDNEEQAMALAQKYLRVIGQLPTLLRVDVDTVWIHNGFEAFGGGNRNLLIHLDQASDYENKGILEEAFIHEASHTPLNSYQATDSEWLSAQAADDQYISTYASDFPTREDVAESFAMYYAVRHWSRGIPDGTKSIIVATMPNRIQYFDAKLPDLGLPVNQG